MAAEYLVAAANEIFLTIDGVNEVTTVDITAAAELGCVALRRLARDQDFRQYVRILSKRHARDRAAFANITGIATSSLDHFISFLGLEIEVMIRGGIEPGLVEELVQQARELIGSIRQWEGNTDQFFTLVAQARNQACALATSLRQEQVHKDHAHAALRRVRGGMLALSGAAIIALNAIAALPNLSPAGTAVSGALGNTVFSWGTDLLRA